MLDADQTAAQLHELVSRLSAESMFHLQTALSAASVPGVGGTLLIEVPRRAGEHPKVRWAGGAQELSLPL